MTTNDTNDPFAALLLTVFVAVFVVTLTIVGFGLLDDSRGSTPPPPASPGGRHPRRVARLP